MDESSSKLLQVILKYPKNFFGWIRKSSHSLWNCPFSSLWLTSTSGCNQNLFLIFALVHSRRAYTATDSTKSIQHTLTDSEEMRERSVSFAVRAHSQEILGRWGCFTAAAKNRSCALAFTAVLPIGPKWATLHSPFGLRNGNDPFPKIVINCILSKDAGKGPNCERFHVLYRRQNTTESNEKITFKL